MSRASDTSYRRIQRRMTENARMCQCGHNAAGHIPMEASLDASPRRCEIALPGAGGWCPCQMFKEAAA